MKKKMLTAFFASAALVIAGGAPAYADDGIISGDAQVETASGKSVSALFNSAAAEKREEAALDAYWTPDRLKSAIPADTAVSEQQLNAVADSLPEETELEASRAKIVAKPVLPYKKKKARTVGKVFFRDSRTGQNYMCSGATVNSSSKRLVLTAGHCVYNAKTKRWHKNWVFIPAYSNGKAPYGKFSAKKMFTTSAWKKYGENQNMRGFAADYAFVATNVSTKTKVRVVKAVGGNGLVIGGTMKKYKSRVVGYPGNLNRGEILRACAKNTSIEKAANIKFYVVRGCNFGGGASGGPWFSTFSTKKNYGYIRSVSSFGPSSSTAFLGSPQISTTAASMYKAANKVK